MKEARNLYLLAMFQFLVGALVLTFGGEPPHPAALGGGLGCTIAGWVSIYFGFKAQREGR